MTQGKKKRERGVKEKKQKERSDKQIKREVKKNKKKRDRKRGEKEINRRHVRRLLRGRYVRASKEGLGENQPTREDGRGCGNIANSGLGNACGLPEHCSHKVIQLSGGPHFPRNPGRKHLIQGGVHTQIFKPHA